MDDLLDVSSFMANLKAKTEALSKPSETKSNKPSSGLVKLFMHAEANQGVITLLPFSDPTVKGNYVTYLDKTVGFVRQFKMKKYKDSKEKDWIRILPKINYGSLSNEESALYDEVCGLFEEVNKAKKMNAREISKKSYVLLYGYILNHFNSAQKTVESSKGKMAMIVLPTKDFSDKQYSNINEITAKLPNPNDYSWTQKYYCNELSGRQHYLRIGFTMNADKKGYTVTVNHMTNNPNDIAGMEVPEGLTITQEQINMISNGHIKDFLGWQVRDGKLFNQELYLRIRDYFKSLLAGVNVTSTPTQAATTVNQADGIIQASPEPVVSAEGHVDPVANIPVSPTPVAPVATTPVIETPVVSELASTPPVEVPPAVAPVAPVAEVPVAPVVAPPVTSVPDVTPPPVAG